VPKTKERPERPALGASWSGTITFGLVSVPVNLYPAHRTAERGLRLLAGDGHPVARRYVCEHDGREVGGDHLVRGFEVEPGRHVVVTDEELEKLAPVKTRDIELRRFVPASALDPVRFDRPYFLTPGSDNSKSYRLLASVMEQSGRAGIATFVMHGKERIIAILSEGGILRGETLRFADEIRTPDQVGLPEPVKADRETVRAFEKSIAAKSKPDLAPAELTDPHAEAMKKLVAKKRRSGERVVAKTADDRQDEEPIDLLEVLKRSLASGKTSSRKGRSHARARAS